MIDQLGKLVRHAGIYGLGTILSRMVSFLLIPVYTRYLTPADYGVLEVVEVSIVLLSLLLSAGISAAVLRFYFNYERIEDRNQVISTALASLFVLTLVFYVPLLVASPYLARILLGGEEMADLFRVAFTTFLFSCGVEIPFSYLRARQRSISFTAINLVRLLLTLVLNIYFVVLRGSGARGVLWSGLIATLLIGLWLVATTLREVGLRFSWPKAREMVAFGAPLIISSLGAFVLYSSDRFFLSRLASLEAVGIYALGYKFGMAILVLLVSPFQMIWSAQMFEIMGRPDAEAIYRKVFTYFNAVLLLFCLGLCLVIDDMMKIVAGQAFWGAASIVPVITLAYVLNGWHTILNQGLLLEKRTSYIAWSTGLAALANVALNYVLIQRYSIQGAAWAALLSVGLRCILSYHYSQKVHPIGYEWGRVGRLFLFAGGVYALSLALPSLPLPASLTLHAGLWFLFPLLLVVAPFLTRAEREWLRAHWRQPWAVLASLRREEFR